MATASGDGAPYIQHRGGPKGFIKVVDDKTLGFADYRGNRQYITLANLSENDRAFLFLLDPARRQRIKLWGRARVVEDDPALVETSVRCRLQGPARTRHPVHHRGLGRELFAAYRHALHRGRGRQTFEAVQGKIAELQAENARPAGAARRKQTVKSPNRPTPNTMNHDSYPDSYIRGILNTVKTIAMVGFSPKENRPSYFVFKYLHGARLPHDPGQSRPRRQGSARTENLCQARRHPRADRHGRHFPCLRTCTADRPGGPRAHSAAAGDLDAAHRAQRRSGERSPKTTA